MLISANGQRKIVFEENVVFSSFNIYQVVKIGRFLRKYNGVLGVKIA